MNKRGCLIEPNSFGLYDLTITEDGKIIRIVREVSFMRAMAIAEEELSDDE